jgi:hypothetical protein
MNFVEVLVVGDFFVLFFNDGKFGVVEGGADILVHTPWMQMGDPSAAA